MKQLLSILIVCIVSLLSVRVAVHAAEAQHTYEFGACAQQLMWRDGGELAAQLEHLDAMKKAGAGWVRLSLIYPTNLDKNLFAILRRCNELNTRKIKIHTFELFNEINWFSFNGDLPLVRGGLMIDEKTNWDNPVFVQYRKGLDKVGKLTRILYDLNKQFFKGEPEIITAGLVGYDTINKALRGAIYTRKEVVEFILDLIGYTADAPLHNKSILEPSFGNGDFLLTIIDRLIISWKSHNYNNNIVKALGDSILAVELHKKTYTPYIRQELSKIKE